MTPPDITDPLFSINGKRIVLTGGGSGIGAALVESLRARGATIEAWDVADCSLAHGIKSRVVDVSNSIEVEEAVEALAADGPVDVLINCAGITSQRRPAEETPLADWERMLRVNYFGTLNTCLSVGRRMLENRSGSIVNFSSVNAVDPSPGIAHYCVSKAAVAMLTRTLALEWADRNVRVNAVGPGPILTPATAPLLETNPELEARWMAGVPIGRLGTPADLTGIVVYLASDASAWSTGTTYYIDGGWLL